MSTKKVLNFAFLFPLPFPNLSGSFLSPEEEELPTERNIVGRASWLSVLEFLVVLELRSH